MFDLKNDDDELLVKKILNLLHWDVVQINQKILASYILYVRETFDEMNVYVSIDHTMTFGEIK